MMHTSRSNMDLNKYVDIIEERRHTSDFMWNSRELRLTKSYNQCQETNNPYKYQDEVLRSSFIQQLIQDVSRDNKISKKQAAQRVTEILNEIGHTRRLPVVRCIGIFFVKVVKKILSGVYVNEAQVLKLKSEMGKNPVIFLPSHRSYADFLLMTYISYHYEIEIPCIAAGMDFQSMWLVGKLLRDCNAFFMRRSFGDDQLYRNIFKAYVQHLVVNGDAPIEFFIEGTRSRSSKALVPKFGLLTMLLEPFFNGDVPDITLVPVSFNYERVLEEALFSYEMLGIPKPKESTSGLIKALRIMNENYGKVYATFNQPISLRKFIKENLGSAVDFTRRDIVRENDFITNLGYHVVDCQQKNMVLNSFNLFAIVLSNHIMVDSLQPLMIESASKEVAWLSAVLSTLGASLHSITHSAAVSIVTDAIQLHESVVRLSANGSIHLATVSNENCKNIDHRKLKGHKLSVDMMNLAVPLLVLQQYINPCLHFLVNPAIITVIMQQIGTTGYITKHELFKKFQFLRELLTYEFVFYKPWEIQEYEDALTKLELVSIIESGEPLRLGNHQKLQAMLCNLLYPFLSGYLSVCRLLQNINLNEWTERQLLRAAQEKIEEELCSGWLLHPYSLSLDMISSCIASLTSMNVLSRKRIGTEVRYYVIENMLISIKTELESLVIGPQKQHRKEQDCIEDPKTLHVISSSEPLQRLVSKL